MKVLAIESSCDETAVAVANLNNGKVVIEKNLIASSAEMHVKYGGIIPEIAAREQLSSIIPLLKEVGVKEDNIDKIVVTFGPGLMGSLLIGTETAKALAWVWRKDVEGINHMIGHVAANWIVDNPEDKVPNFPCLALVVSGGHTDFLWIESKNEWSWIGGTRDDAAGEAYDKGARLLGLPYPGGVAIEKISAQATRKVKKLPRPMLNEGGLEMSFSGLKAALAKEINNTETVDKAAWAKEYNEAIVEVLVKKTELAINKKKPASFLLCGGVAANSLLRENLKHTAETLGVDFFVPKFSYCTDNAAMIAAAGLIFEDKSERDFKSPNPSLENY